MRERGPWFDARHGAVLEAVRSLPQPFLVPDVRRVIGVGYSHSEIFHLLRDLFDHDLLTWNGSEGYRVSHSHPLPDELA